MVFISSVIAGHHFHSWFNEVERLRHETEQETKVEHIWYFSGNFSIVTRPSNVELCDSSGYVFFTQTIFRNIDCAGYQFI